MSRCFPFPPPGYEKKARTDEVDLLTKEKQKEKKHKKDKKRDGKEKKDKDRSKDKHKEKKDRKEKHKDKKKDKDREKDKKKNSDEKKVEGGAEGYNGGKQSEISQQPGEIKESKFVEDLGRRIEDEASTRSQRVENLTGTDQRRAEGMGRVVEKDFSYRVENLTGTDQRRTDGMGRVVEKDFNNRVENLTGTDQRRAEGMGRMVEKDFSKRVENLIGTDQRRAGGMDRVLERDFNVRGEGKEISNGRKFDDKKADVQRNRDGDGGVGNAVVRNFTGMDQRRTGSMARLMEKDAEKNITVKEKEKNKIKVVDKQGDKHKNREKKSKGKDKVKDKEKEKEKEKEKLKEKGDHKNNRQDKFKDSSKDPLDTLNIKPSQIPKDSNNNAAATEGNFRKRKDLDTNGFLHDNDIRPNKLLKPTLSSHPLTENGRTLEPFQIANQKSASDRHGTGNNLKEENKERKVNGVIEAPGSSGNSTKSSLASLHINENGVASTRPPHPDCKYLSQILSVPKMEEWSDFDDQEWLFSSNKLQTKKPKVVASGVEEKPEVWAEAIRIESADVCALPYVIPY